MYRLHGGGRVFHQAIGIPLGTNCAPLFASLLFHSYSAAFLADLIQRKENRLARFFHISFRYIDDVLSLNNPSFGDFIHLIQTKELEIKDTTNCEVSLIS